MAGDTFFPGSKIPFNPINPHGAKAKYPDGWKNPLKEKLFQVFVEDKDRGYIAIGPKFGHGVANEFCANVKIAIKTGRISGWTNPHVLPAPAEQVRWSAA